MKLKLGLNHILKLVLRINYLLNGLLIAVVLLIPNQNFGKPITIRSHIQLNNLAGLPNGLLGQTLHLKDSLQWFYQTDLAGTLMLEEFGFYLHFQGINSIYKWSGSSFVNLYDRNFHGFNFESISFVKDSAIYNYGGSGFWQNNGILSFFNEELGEWEFLYSTVPDLNLFHNSAKVHFLLEDELFFIYGESLDQRRVAIESNWAIGRLNLSDFKYVHLKGNQEVLNRLVQNNWYRGFDGLDLYISLNYIGQKINVIDKKALTFAEIPVVNLSSINFPFSNKWLSEHITFVFCHENRFEFLDKKFQRIGSIDLTELEKGLYDWQPLKEESSFSFWFLLLLIPILSIGSFVLWNNLNRSSKNKIRELPFPYPKLLELDGQIVSQKNLHSILGIDSNLSSDSIRTKRARILREINLLYGDLVTIDRIEDSSDRRIFNYKIKVYR